MTEIPERRTELPGLPASAGEARRFVTDVLHSFGVDLDGVTDTAVLLTSELVTNALLYTAGTIAIAVAVDLPGAGLRVAVEDEGKNLPSLRVPSSEATSGRGLGLVQALADAWGVVNEPDDGKVVWFELPIPGA